MNISIKGHLKKERGGWSVEIGILEKPIEGKSPLKCLKKLEEIVMAELGDEKQKCFFKINDNGVFYFITANSEVMINFLAARLTDMSIFSIDPDLDFER